MANKVQNILKISLTPHFENTSYDKNIVKFCIFPVQASVKESILIKDLPRDTSIRRPKSFRKPENTF